MAGNSVSTAPAIAAIAFDLGNVLIRVDHHRFCRRLGEAAGVSPWEVYEQVFASGLEPAYDTGRLSSQEFFQEVCRRFRIDLPFALFAQWWQDIFDPLESMDEVVEELSRRFPLFLVSNTNALHFPHVHQRFPVLHRMRRFILSYQVGSRKPEPGIFQALIREIPCAPGECLFVDDLAPFVAAARRHGLRAWQFSTPEDFRRRLRQHGLY